MDNGVYRCLLDRLAGSALVTDCGGVPKRVKPVPDRSGEGVLDPRVLATLRAQAAAGGFPRPAPGPVDPKTFPVETLRAAMGWPNEDLSSGGVQVADRMIPGPRGPVLLRSYAPEAAGRRPAVVFFHGGGFFGGSLKAVENPCKVLAEKAGATVFSVDYALAPERPFPAGLRDCLAAVRWVSENADALDLDAGRLVVSGDSAGGNLAAACAIMDRNEGTRLIAAQALIYPVVTIPGEPIGDYEWSLDQYDIREERETAERAASALRASGLLLKALYLQGHTADDPLVSPLYLNDAAGLPPAFISVAEYDALRLEGEAFARKLSRSGVPVRLVEYKGMDHAFMDKLGLYPQAEDLMAEIAAWIKTALPARTPER